MSSEEKFALLFEQQAKLLETMQSQIALLQQQVVTNTGDSGASRVSVPWPQPLEVETGNQHENLEFFKNGWQNYCLASGIDKWPPAKAEIKAGLLISAVGSTAMKKYMEFGLTEKEKKDEVLIFKKIEEYISKETNIIYSRYLFNARMQLQGEDFSDYLLALKKLIKPCQYGMMEKEILRDRIVVGILNGETKKEMLRKADLDLEIAINICKSAETANKQLTELQKSEDIEEKSVNKINEHKSQKELRTCKFCGNKHIFNKNVCPAYKKRCEKCKGWNHLAKVCKKKYVREINEQSPSEDSEDSVYISEIKINKRSGHREAPLLFKVGKKAVKAYCVLDTGSQVCTMGINYYKTLTGCDKLTNLKPSTHKLRCFNNTEIVDHGTTIFECISNQKKYSIKFHVVDVEHKPLLSEKACLALGFIKYCNTITKNEINNEECQKLVNKFHDVFEGYGCLPGEVALEFDNNIPPKIQPPRRIPMALRDKLKSELEQLEKDKIIVKELSHTDWVNNILIVKKESKFRICLDPIPLNKATLDEMLPELSKAKVFSTVDAKKGFWQISLDEESSKLTTFWTPFGRYRWLRLPFGLTSSPEIFQQKLTSLLHDLKGIEIIADDILIYGVGDNLEEAIKDHNIKLEKLFMRLREINCKLNIDKANFLQTSVKYYGHYLTKDGLQVDKTKVDAIKNMPTPTSSKDVLRFLGMVSYLSKFINNLSYEAHHLRQLTRKDVMFKWTDKEEKEFVNLKSIISDLPTLKYFELNKDVVIECDASEFGLGAALYQNNQIISFASRCLTSTQKKYAQIEKEMLAVVFACTRFNQYIVGNPKIIIKTDHKPLINILNKPLTEAPKRLQMMLLTLQKYNIELQYIQGKDNIVADTLSRAPMKDEDENIKEKKDNKEKKIFKIINKISIIKYLKISDKLIEKIKTETQKDLSLQKVIEYIINGFPDYISDMPAEIQIYHKFRHELSTTDGLILRNDQVLIPVAIREELMIKVHASHNGTIATLRLARINMFWPGMSKDIKNFIERCKFCVMNSTAQQKLPLKSHDVPRYPFQYVSMDVFTVNQDKYLVTVDHYSDYFELDKLKSLTAMEIVDICKINFSRHGIPQRVCTDNATNFNNVDFKRFANSWNFEHVTSSPRYAQSNGKAEITVKMARRIVLQSLETKNDLWYSLLHLRNVPNEDDLASPVQKLYSRRTRTGLPCLLKHLMPKVIPNMPKIIKERKEKYKANYDKGARDTSVLKIGQNVAVLLNPENSTKWVYGRVVDVINDRSYVVAVDGKEYRRNRIHIRPCPEDVSSGYKRTLPADSMNKTSRATQVLPSSEPYDSGTEIMFPAARSEFSTESQRTPQQDPVPVADGSHAEPRRSTRVGNRPARFNDYDMS